MARAIPQPRTGRGVVPQHNGKTFEECTYATKAKKFGFGLGHRFEHAWKEQEGVVDLCLFNVVKVGKGPAGTTEILCRDISHKRFSRPVRDRLCTFLLVGNKGMLFRADDYLAVDDDLEAEFEADMSAAGVSLHDAAETIEQEVPVNA